MKDTTLRRHMTYILAGFLAALLVMGAVNMAAGIYGYRHLNETYSLFAVYNGYDRTAGELYDAVVDFMIGDMPEARALVLAKADEVEALSGQMYALSGHTQFADAYQLSLAYTDLARQCIGEMEQPLDIRMEEMRQLERMYALILTQYDTLGRHITAVVDENIAQNARMWGWQLVVTVLLGALMLGYTVWAALGLGKRVVTPITELTEAVQRFKRDGEHLPAASDGGQAYSELRILHEAFDDMTLTISAQIEELRDKIALTEALHKKEVALSQAELGLMQSLINPHFLYNCLSTLSALAAMEQAPRTKKSAILIASFLRTSLDYLGKEITIREELEYTRSYVDIQRLRFDDRIAFDISCDPTCQDTKIPAILLQPLVENAIQHGVKSYAAGARIVIRAERQGDAVQMSVTDNGVGIPADKLAELRYTLASDFSPAQRGLGLRSVAYRLRSLFPDGASVAIDSVPGHTEVRLLIPAVEME